MTFSLLTIIGTTFIIPVVTKQGCLTGSYYFYIFLRCISHLTVSLLLSNGFLNEPPHESNKRPLFEYISQLLVLNIPFVFAFIEVMRWSAIKTSISLFNTLVLKRFERQLKLNRSHDKAFPEDEDETPEPPSRITGYLFLLLMISLLFVPLVFLSSSSTTTDLNPGLILSYEFGIPGLPSFYEARIPKGPYATIAEQEEIRNLTYSNELIQFYSNKREQVQKFQVPSGSLSFFEMTSLQQQEIIKNLKENNTEFYPYLEISIIFRASTTLNSVNNIVMNLNGEPLSDEARHNLTIALENKTEGTIIKFENILPAFLGIPHELEAFTPEHFFYDIILTLAKNDESDSNKKTLSKPSNSRLFSNSNSKYLSKSKFSNSNNKRSLQFNKQNKLNLQSNGNDDSYFWTLEVTGGNVPEFMTKDGQMVLLWSQPVPGKITGRLLSSVGGIMGLYAFIILTIGQFITSWIDSLFTDLWLERCKYPQKLLNVLMAIEAYRIAEDWESEHETAELLLEAMRSTERIIRITDIPDKN
jgi:hypothetical protein